MIFPENQVRNFYVVKGISVPTNPTVADAGKAEAYVKNGNFYVKYVDANGKAIVTDRVKLSSIRDVRISVPDGFTARTWTVTMTNPVTVANGDTFMLYLELGNIFNFGEGERFFYSYPIVKTSNITTAAQLATAFAEMLGKVLKYNKVMASAFESIEANGANLVFTEAKQDFNTILRFYPHPIKVNITSAAVHTNGTTEDYVSGIAVGTSAANSRNNGYKIAAMENYFSRVRADLYGYNGFPDINPSKMITSDSDNNTYYVLDIKYYRDLHGVNVQKSEKEMTFASTNLSDLLALIDEVKPIEGTWEDDNFTFAFINSQEDLNKYKFMLNDYYAYEEAHGRTPANKDTWNGDGWVVGNYKTKPGAGKKGSVTYNGNTTSDLWTTTANSTYVILSVTDPSDGISVSPASNFDKSKFSITLA